MYFPFVEIPKEYEPIIGTPDPGTHMYRREGSGGDCALWFHVLSHLIGASVSPGGVGMYCPASRAAVYKQIKDGKLSIFLFHVTHQRTTLFGKNKIARSNPYGYVPVSEIRAWRKELEERAVQRGLITEEEIKDAAPDSVDIPLAEEDAKPDWGGEFLQWRDKKGREDLFDMLDEEGISFGRFMMEFARSLIKKDSGGFGAPSPPSSPPRTRAQDAAFLRKERAIERKRRQKVKEIIANAEGGEHGG